MKVDKVAILIDGAYFTRRLRKIAPARLKDSGTVVKSVEELVNSHLKQLNSYAKRPHYRSLLYKTYFYDAKPYNGRAESPISKTPVNYGSTAVAKFMNDVLSLLNRTHSVALRLGTVQRAYPGWRLSNRNTQSMLSGQFTSDHLENLNDDDFVPNFQQKGVDMKIGIDIATIALKKHADTIVLVAGDADFAPATKFARQEGLKIILDPLWQGVPDTLFEHIDGVTSGWWCCERDGNSGKA